MIIERVSGTTVIGWFDTDRIELHGAMLSHEQGDVLVSTGLLSECVLSQNTNQKRYFRLDVGTQEAVRRLIAGEDRLLILAGSEMHALRVFGPLKETLKLADLDLARLGSTFRLLPPKHREALRRAVEYGTSTHLASKVKRKLACIFTYANDSGGWFDCFYSHYVKQLGDPRAIYVATPSPASFAGYDLGGVLGIDGFAYDDHARSQLMMGLAKGFSAYFEWIIVADVDELIFADPRSGARSIQEFLESRQLPSVNFSVGFDVIQVEGESYYQDGVDLFLQRRYVIPNSGMCKPHVTRGDVVLDIGYHYCQVPTDLPAPGSGFLMFHLKYACSQKRQAVGEIVQKTTYSSEDIEKYAFSSVVMRQAHPGLAKASLKEAVNLEDWDIDGFASRIAAAQQYDPERDVYGGKNFVDEAIVHIGQLASASSP